MSGINMLEDLEKQGLDKDKYYEAIVVNNDDTTSSDGHMRKRIQARVPVLWEGIVDDHLPWAVSMYPDEGDGTTVDHGTCNIPVIGSKVFLMFQNGSEDHPMYYPYSGDDTTVMELAKVNYPQRKVTKFSNGCYFIIDKSNNELILFNPGDTKITIMGNVTLYVEKNVDAHVKGNVTANIDGNLDARIQGNTGVVTEGSLNVNTSGSTNIHSDGAMTLSSGGGMTLTAPSIAHTQG